MAWPSDADGCGSARPASRRPGCSTWTSTAAPGSGGVTWPRWSCTPPAPATAPCPYPIWTPTTRNACATCSAARTRSTMTPERPDTVATSGPDLPPALPGAVPPAPQATAADAERRLHPMSWLFVLLQQLKQFIVPLIALLVFGRGDRNELWPLIGVAVLALGAVWRYFTYRYGVTGDALVVRSGLLERSL